MSKEDVLRLLAIRPPVRKVSSWRLVPAYGSGRGQSDLHDELRAAGPRTRESGRHVELAQGFRASGLYVQAIDSLEFDMKPLLAWAKANGARLLPAADLPGELSRSYSSDASTLVATSLLGRTWNRLADTLLADAIASKKRTPARDELTASLKLLWLIDRTANAPQTLPTDMTLGGWLQRTVVVLPKGLRRPGFANPRPAAPPSPSPSARDDKRLKALVGARDTLLRLVGREGSFERGAPPTPPTPPPGPAGPGRVPHSTQFLKRNSTEGMVRSVLASGAVSTLSASTRALLAELRFDTARLDPFEALTEIDAEIASEAALVIEAKGPATELRMGSMTVDTQLLQTSLIEVANKPMFVDKAPGCGFEVGVGDLLVVRQELKAYELTDFAHVENVLAGELREREHRRLRVREETITTETEQETQKDRDLQSTDRNEMQTEAEKTLKSEMGIDAGLQLSGSYGPTVSFSSSLSVSFSVSSEETEKNAASFSREVTEKTAERTRERLREEVKRRTLEQTEELNRHTIDNSDASNGHVRGIYRWLNKVYDAQVFNYGQRMMFEFVVPEPAAYFLWAMLENPPTGSELVKPTFPTLNNRRLKATDLTLDNVQIFLTALQMTDAPTYPVATQVVSHFDGLDDAGPAKTLGRGTKVVIPSGYETNTALISAANAGDLETFFVFVGGKDHVPLYDGLQKVLTFSRKFAGEISVSVYGGNTAAYSLGIDFFCTLSEFGKRKWQQETFEAIVRAYLVQKADYEDKLAALQIQKGIQILGRNPLENRRIERDELKKLTLSMLTDDDDPSLDAFVDTAEPVIDVEAACAAGSRIRFFENAFEWRNMTYALYPYFWGRKARWLSALQLTDPDPDFAAFLKAGAARVQVPVRPGFESAITYYCQTGNLWNGGDPPLIDDELYVPIVEEITASLGKLDDGVAYPEGSVPWELRVPTDLVLLQNLEEIPGIRDTLTDQVAIILPPNA
jgi:hypothetical protein